MDVRCSIWGLVALCDDNKHNFLLYSPDGKLKKGWIKEYPGAHGIELFEEGGKEFFIVVVVLLLLRVCLLLLFNSLVKLL